MAKEDEVPGGGLLSKMVRFVRNPLTNWSDLDEPELDKESKYSKQMLKEMIERKRRNDFVRRREFDQLRKLRRREPLSGTDPAGRPSFFQSSMPSTPDDRAVTLKKIDEIEAQMSMQWWKTKHAGDPGASSASASNGSPVVSSSPVPDGAAGSTFEVSSTVSGPASGGRPSQAYAPTEPGSLASLGGDSTLPPPFDPVAARRLAEAPASAPLAEDMPGLGAQGARSAHEPRAYDTAAGYTSSKLIGAEPSFVHDPELEEAAIRFANGDYEGAESGLMEALRREDLAPEAEGEIWLTLFDLYRATGLHDRFEASAIEYAGRFGRSAPLWFSLPDMLAPSAAGTEALAGASGVQGYVWNSPETLGVQSVAALNAALGRNPPQPWRLNWTRLAAVEGAALEPLCKLFTSWCQADVQLQFQGAESLERLLAASTRSGDRSVDANWWRLRMEALRIMGRSDEFELVALDYCVTYEVSPPSWQSVRCNYLLLSDDGMPGMANEFVLDEGPLSIPPSSGLGMSDIADLHTQPFNPHLQNEANTEMSGQVLGDAGEALAAMEQALADGASTLVVSCDRLVRIDFSAAGSVLNWVAGRQADGGQIVFCEVHRLVAIFFNVIGINEHAKVLTRTT